MVIKSSHICVCICTYKRTRLLAHLLNKLQNQVTEQLFSYSIIVVDNDLAQSAKNIVEFLNEKSKIDIDYYNEPEQNISLARNKAIQKAKGNYIAFIDDDEFPVNEWLLNLYKTCNEYKVDGALGPVNPHFEKDPPRWIIKGKLFERPYHKTGLVLHWRDTRTGNVLLRRNIFDGNKNVFDPAFGAGGEDKDFFKRMIEKGYVFVWCNEAPVYEIVPPERWGKTFFINKFSRIGGLSGEKARKQSLGAYQYLAKSIVIFSLFALLLPISFLIGQHVYIKCLIKVVHDFSWILGFFGIVIHRHKND